MLITFELCSIQNVFFAENSRQTYLDIVDLEKSGSLRVKTSAVAYADILKYDNAIGRLTINCSTKYFPVNAAQQDGSFRTRQILDVTVDHFEFTPAKMTMQGEKAKP